MKCQYTQLAFSFRIVVLLLTSCSLSAQWSAWSEAEYKGSGLRYVQPEKYQLAQLNISELRAKLKGVALEGSIDIESSPSILEIPAPHGGMEQFRIVEAPMMHPDLQARFPEIRCYRGFNLSRPDEIIRCDVTPHGFHAMVTGSDSESWFVEPYAMGDDTHYTIYRKQDHRRTSDFLCAVENDAHTIDATSLPEAAGDCQYRLYRLALSCTGEYAAFHGGTVQLALAAMNTTMNRCNGIFEREIGVRLVLISNNDLLVYLNAATDPFTNNNGDAMLNQNQTTVDAVIGSANYDIGHVFSTGGGGIASLGSVCGATVKARGVTGAAQPIGDFFDVDYVAHEMGHQFGAQHTFYNSCNGNISSGSAFEPGSGSTIMSYAGICAPNVQNAVDDYYHAHSLQQIGNYLGAGGNVCGTKQPTGNLPPEVNAGADYYIPVSTPFALTATGSDPNASNTLTYCWEQMNNERNPAAAQPPLATSVNGPRFRSLKPSFSPTRFFPNLTSLNANQANTWEVLPSVTDTLNFRVTVRDNATPAGCTAEDNVVLYLVGSAGPFVVTAPNTAVVWNVGESQNVTWNVANTTAAPINAAQVKITLSTDGGLTYPYVLADGVPNNGTASVSVPNQVSTTCRVKVEGKGNVFFDISNVNFTIQNPPTPTFLLATTLPQSTACANQPYTVNVQLTSVLGYNNPVQMSVSGLPPGITSAFSSNPATPGSTVTLTLSGFTSASNGPLNFTITGVSGTITQNANVSAQMAGGAPPAPALISPLAGATAVSTAAILTWAAAPQASRYEVQVSTNPSFATNTLVLNQTILTTSTALTNANSSTVYFWRVRAINSCGESAWSTASSFQTAACQVLSNTTPVAIPTVATTVSSTISGTGGTIVDMNVGVIINHSWIGDLEARLTSPGGTTIKLFDRPGFPGGASNFGCDSDNIEAIFDDQATLTAAQFEATCNPTPPAISGIYNPFTPLSGFNGSTFSGTWTLAVQDYESDDAGSIVRWDIQVCTSVPLSGLQLVTNQTLSLASGTERPINANLLNATSSSVGASGIQFMLLSLPSNGTLKLNGIALNIGSTFTQADVTNGNLSYQHTNTSGSTDQFNFQVTENPGTGWLQNQVFRVNILQNSITASASLTQGITCFNQNNAIITVTASGGNAPLSYSLNGGSYISQNVFSGLPAGSYTVSVRDALGFLFTTNTVTVNNPAELTLSAAVNNNQITLTSSGGTGALLYSLNGGPSQSSPIFSGLSNGAYTCVVTDANGCTKSVQAVVAVNTLVVGAAVQNQITCNGLSNGSIVVTAGGGQQPYTYTLSNGTTQVGNPIFTNLGVGTYTVSVRDGQGFTVQTNAVTITQPNPVQATSTTNQFQITVTATGGTGSYEYSLNGGSYQSQPVFTVTTNGTYTITVRDNNGCTTTTQAVVSVNTLAVSLSTQNQISCNGAADGSVQVIVSGGQQPLTFTLSNGVTQIGNPIFTNLSAGTYSVTVKDAQNFTAQTNAVILTNPSAITASASTNLNQISVSASGGTGLLQYSLNGGSPQSTPTFTVQSNGTYTITVRDQNGCTTQTTATVSIAPPTVSAQVTGQILCFGQSTGQITVNAVGGLMPYTFTLNNGAPQSQGLFTGLPAGAYEVRVTDSFGGSAVVSLSIVAPSALSVVASASSNTITATAIGGTAPYMYALNGGVSQASNIFTGLANGTYSILVTDNNGCTTTTTATVNTAALGAMATLTGNIRCFGDKTLSITVSAVGGVSPYTYAISGGAPQTNPVFTGLGAGVYVVIVTDSQGATSSTTVNASQQPPALSGTVTVNGGTATTTAIGGTPPYQYSLNNSPVQSSPIFTNLNAGTYPGIVITDANGCTFTTAGFTVTVSTEQLVAAFGMQIMPNPSAGVFRIIQDHSLSDAVTFRIFDMQGRQVILSQDMSAGQTEMLLDLTHLAAGTYLLQAYSARAHGTTRLVVMKQ